MNPRRLTGLLTLSYMWWRRELLRWAVAMLFLAHLRIIAGWMGLGIALIMSLCQATGTLLQMQTAREA